MPRSLIDDVLIQHDQTPYDIAVQAYDNALEKLQETEKNRLLDDGEESSRSAAGRQAKRHITSLDEYSAKELISSGAIPKDVLKFVDKQRERTGKSSLDVLNEIMQDKNSPMLQERAASEICDHVLGDASDSHGLPNNMSGKTETAIG